ncbi:MAG: hypothetical protein V5A88_03860 [Candidatus Thermoplasmatota archaeon]
MSKGKKFALVAAVWVVIIVAALVTNSFLPPLVKDNFGLYESYEYSQMYLEDDPYSELIIEYDYVEARTPNQEAMDTLEDRVEEYTEKEKITSELDDTIPPLESSTNPPYSGSNSYDADDISDLEDEYRDYEREGDTVSIHMLYLDGEWKENERALGLSKKPYSIVVFSDVVEVFSTRTDIESWYIERGVLVHEFGHLLSLVGIGYQTDHTDPNYPSHCDESAGDCVMAAAVEYKREGDNDPPPDDFCELCQEDLERIKEMKDDFALANLIAYGTIIGEVMLASAVSVAIIMEEKKKPGGRNTTSEPPYPYQNKDRGLEREKEIRFQENDHLGDNDEF